MSTQRWATAWKLPIGRPNWLARLGVLHGHLERPLGGADDVGQRRHCAPRVARVSSAASAARRAAIAGALVEARPRTGGPPPSVAAACTVPRRRRAPLDERRLRRHACTATRIRSACGGEGHEVLRPRHSRPVARRQRRRGPLVAPPGLDQRQRRDHLAGGDAREPAPSLRTAAQRSTSGAASTAVATNGDGRSTRPISSRRSAASRKPSAPPPCSGGTPGRASRGRPSPARARGSKPRGSASIARTCAIGQRRARKARADRRAARCSAIERQVQSALAPRQAEAALGDDVLLDLERPRGDRRRDVAHPLAPDAARERRLRRVVRELPGEAEELEPDVADELLELGVVEAGDRRLDASGPRPRACSEMAR